MNRKIFLIKSAELTKAQILLLLLAVPYNFVLYYSGRAVSRNFYHWNLSCVIDSKIPFVPWTIFIYWGCYIFWIINYYLGTKSDNDGGFRFILAHYLGELICFLFFICLPTTMVRPEVTGTTLPELIVRYTYATDSADNLLPSIHCFASWLCWIGVRDREEISKWYRFISLFFAIAVCVSTMTVKQHVFVDVVFGICVAELSFFISKSAVSMYNQRY